MSPKAAGAKAPPKKGKKPQKTDKDQELDEFMK
jgi:hypothetical protein